MKDQFSPVQQWIYHLSYQSGITFSHTHRQEVTWQGAKRAFLEARISVNIFFLTMEVGTLDYNGQTIILGP